MRQWMKNALIVLLVIGTLLVLVSCGTAKVTLPDSIDKITISWKGGPATTFSYTDAEKIDQLAAYFTSLELQRTSKDPMQYNGGGWVITLETQSASYGLHHYGHQFFKTTDGIWWEIPYMQAEAFEALLKELVPDVMPEQLVFSEWKVE